MQGKMVLLPCNFLISRAGNLMFNMHGSGFNDGLL